MPAPTFDKAYYTRFYRNADTRAVTPREQQQQADFIAAYLIYLQIPQQRILDIGCGLGVVLERLTEHFPDARCQGVEYSSYLCEIYGWRPGSVVDYRDKPYDLVVCNDVLGYLNKKDCARAIRNLAALTRGALYLSVLTSDDLDICDSQHTDMQQRLRPADWYHKHLHKHFVAVGGGLFLPKPLQYPVWHMERPQG